MLAASTALIAALEKSDESGQLYVLVGYALGVLAVIMLLLLVVIISRESQSSLAESQEQNERNQRAILRLLDEMTNLADGDLTATDVDGVRV